MSPAAPFKSGAAALAITILSEASLAERDMALVLREAELNRREATLRRAEEARAEDVEGSLARASSVLEAELAARLAEVQRREHELEEALGAVESQHEPESLAPAASVLEAELATRLAEVQRRERELEQALGAVDSQRDRLEARRGEE